MSSKLYRGNIINTASVPVFKDPDLVNYNIDRLFKAIKDNTYNHNLSKWQKVYCSTKVIVG